MAIRDLEIPLFRQLVGSTAAYPFDFSAVIPTGMAVVAYQFTFEASHHSGDVLEYDGDASSASVTTVLAAFKALSKGEVLVTAMATIGTDGLREFLQARIIVE